MAQNRHLTYYLTCCPTHLTLLYKPLPPWKEKNGSDIGIFRYKEFENCALCAVLDFYFLAKKYLENFDGKSIF